MIFEVMSRKQMNNFKQWEMSNNYVGVFPLESKESDFFNESTSGIINPHFLKDDTEAEKVTQLLHFFKLTQIQF